MTERMENALNHIKTSVDVDPWAIEEVERVFDELDDIKSEIKALGEEMRITQKSFKDERLLIGFNMAIALCNKHIGKEQK